MTAVPTSIDFLCELLRGNPDLTYPDGSKVQIEDGPPTERPDVAAMIVVGWVPEEGETVDWSATSGDLGGGQNQSFSLQGLVSYLDSDSNMKNARDKADALLETLRRVVSKNPRLGGSVNRAELVTVGATPDQGADGAEWAIRWAINARVF